MKSTGRSALSSPQTFWVIVALFLVWLLGSLVWRAASLGPEYQAAAAANAAGGMGVEVTRWPLAGLADASLTPALSATLAQQAMDAAWARQAERGRAAGKPPLGVQIHSGIVTAEGRPFLVLKLEETGWAHLALIAGTDDVDLVVVSCISGATQPVPLDTGPCADKVLQTHGVRLP